MIISFIILVTIVTLFIYNDVKSNKDEDTKYYKKQDKRKVEFYNRLNDSREQTQKKPK